MKVRLRGKWWKVVRWALRKRWGECDWDNHALLIAPKIQGQILMATLLHEGIHVCQPDLKEDAVEEIATSLTSLLTLHGFSNLAGDDVAKIRRGMQEVGQSWDIVKKELGL